MSSEWQVCGGKYLVDVSGQRSEWADWLETMESQQEAQIITGYDQDLQNSVSEGTTPPTFQQCLRLCTQLPRKRTVQDIFLPPRQHPETWSHFNHTRCRAAGPFSPRGWTIVTVSFSGFVARTSRATARGPNDKHMALHSVHTALDPCLDPVSIAKPCCSLTNASLLTHLHVSEK